MTKCLLHIFDSCSHVWFIFDFYSYASIRTRCFDNWFISRFRLIIALHIREYSSFDEMSWQTIYISQFSTFVTCSDFESCLHAKLCSMFNRSFRLFDSITYVLKCFSSKCSIRNCLHERRFFYNLCSICNIFVLISRCFHRNVRSEIVSHKWRFFL